MPCTNTEDYSYVYEEIRERHGISTRKYKSPGFCEKCKVFFQTKAGGHEPKDCRNPPYCAYHKIIGHAPTDRCKRRCPLCCKWGHTKLHCHKIKDCKLCGKSGHNPIRCWEYCTIKLWMERAEELNRCGECLTLFTTDTKRCTICCTQRVYWKPTTCTERFFDKESQTETNTTKDQESQMETIIDDQKLQTEEFKKQVAILEDKLEKSLLTINSLSWQLQATIQERENALYRAQTLNSVCHARDLELIDAKSIMEELQEEIREKDLELKQHRKITNTQPSCSPLAACSLEHTGELKQMKASLQDLQVQQQKISMIISHLYYGNRIKTPDTTNYLNSYPSFSFNPYMGLWDTGQNSNKLQQV